MCELEKIICVRPPQILETAAAIAAHLDAHEKNSAIAACTGHKPPRELLQEVARILAKEVMSQNGIIHIRLRPNPDDYYYLSTGEKEPSSNLVAVLAGVA